MNFLNVGLWELTLVLIIAITLLGPRRTVEIARSIGRVTAQLRQLSNEFVSTLQTEILTAEREASQTQEKIVAGVAEPLASIRAELQATERETRRMLADNINDSPGQETG